MIKFDWDNEEKTVILYQVVGAWTWKEYFEATDQMAAMIEAVPHNVYVIGNFAEAGAVPTKNIIQYGKKSAETRHPRNVLTVLVGLNRFYRAMYDVYRSVYPRGAVGIEVRATVDDARRLIQQRQREAENG